MIRSRVRNLKSNFLCTIYDPVQVNGDINCYAGQWSKIQPLHKRVNGHRLCFDVNENLQTWENQHCPSMAMSRTKITSTSEILKLWPTNKDVQHP